MKNRILFPLLAAIIAIAFAGCSSTPKIKPYPWKVSITKRTPASIEMDVLGVTPTDRAYLENVSWDDYWKPDSQIRKDALEMGGVTKFLKKDEAWVISPEDTEYKDNWKRWQSRGAIELLLLARLPESGGLWKVPVSLDKKAWSAKDRTIQVEVLDSRIVVLTPPRN